MPIICGNDADGLHLELCGYCKLIALDMPAQADKSSTYRDGLMRCISLATPGQAGK